MSMSIRGMASGLDVDNIIDELIRIEQRPIVQMEQEKSVHQERIDSWRDINTRLYNLRETQNQLLNRTDFAPIAAQSTQGGIADAVVSPSATEGVFNLEVTQLATNHRVTSQRYDNIASSLGLAGTFEINGLEVQVAENDSIINIRDQINTLMQNLDPTIDIKGVNANIIDNRLVLESAQQGLEGVIEVNDNDDLLLSLGVIDEAAEFINEAEAAQDALFSFQGVEIQSGSNYVANVQQGIDLDLFGAGHTLIEVRRDFQDVTADVNAFVEQFNSTFQFIREKQERGALLQGDPSLMRLEQDLRQSLTNTVGANLNDNLNQVAVLGLTMDWETSLLEFDQGKFTKHLQENPQGVQALFQASENYQSIFSDGLGNGLKAKALGEDIRLIFRQASSENGSGVEVSHRTAGGYRIDVFYEAGMTVGDLENLIRFHQGDDLAGEKIRASDLVTLEVTNNSILAQDTSVNLAGEGFDGVLRRMDNFLGRTLHSSTGTGALRTNYYDSMMRDLDFRIDRVAERVERTKARLIRQFTNLETVLSEMMSQGQWLSQQLQSLDGFNSRRD